MDVAKPTFWLIQIIVASIVLGCSGTKEQMGGQVTGGGSVAKSTAEQVNAALDQALQLAENSDVERNIIVQFWTKNGSKSKTASISQPAHVFPNFTLSTSKIQVRFENKFAVALKQNTITRLPKGDCPHPTYEETADASVSALNYEANLCFSIGNLTRIPPADLLREVLSLVVHEVTHMGGAGEPEAKAWQQEFSDYFGQRFGDITADIRVPTFEKITEAHLYLSMAQEHYNQNPTDERIAGDIGTMAGVVESLPFYNDPIAIKLKMNPPHPELIGLYTEAVSALIESVRSKFQNYSPPEKLIAFSTDRLESRGDNDNAALAQKYLNAITEYNKDIDRIYDTFLAFSESNYHLKTAEPQPSKSVQAPNVFSVDTER